MKQSLLLVPGFAWLVASSCCRVNSCLREIATEGVPGRNGLEDCSSHLAVTVTPSAQTVYKTTTVELIEAVTQVESKVSTSRETSTASTETVFFTVKASTTAATETKLVTAFETVVAATETQTSTTTVTKAGLKARQDGGVVPSYASSVCKDFAEYKAACGCAGVHPVTVTAPAPVETVVVTETSSVQSTVLVTAAAVKTVTVLVTETTSQATTELELLTDTVTATTTETAFVTTTTDATVTETASTCIKGVSLGSFKASSTDYNNTPYFMFAQLLNGFSGGIVWQPPSVSTSPSVQNKYIWSLDEEGRLGLALSVPPFTYKYTAYISTALTGSNWPQMGISTNVAAQVAAGARIDYVTGCVDAATGELHLNAAGRTNILWCGAQLWMSTGKGEDINRGTCVVMHPRAEKLA